MKLNHPKNIKKLKDVFKNKPVTINYEGCSWEILKYSYKVSKKYNLGFLHLCRDLICFDITKEKILWTLKDLTGTLISFKIVDSKEKIFLEDEYRKRFIEISYDGEIIKNRFGLIDEYRERTYKNSLLKSRQETILSWLCKSEFLRDIEKRDLLSEDKEIYKNFIESKKKFLEENHCSRTHYTIEKNNEKILKKYLSKNFDKFLISKCNNDKSLSSLQTRAGNIVSEFIGKEKYKEMVNEFYRKYEAGEINYSSCALSKYFCRILKNKKPKFEGTKKHCIYCTKLFYPGIIPFILKKYHPKNEPIEFCQSCLVSALWGSYKKKKTKKQAIDDLKKLVKILGYIPPSNFFQNTKFIKYIPKEIFNEVIKCLIEIIPYEECTFPPEELKNNTYKNLFGSWLKTLVGCELLKGDIRELPRGTMCIAEDNHDCLSMAEKQVCDWLYDKKIKHTREPKYPKDKELNPNFMRADWKVGKIFIEFFGLVGNKEYDLKIKKKIEICKKYNIDLIDLYPKDLVKLHHKLGVLLKK